MIHIDPRLSPADLLPAVHRMFEFSGQKIIRLQDRWDPAAGTPVFTVGGQYTARGWTEWTQGFQFGSALLQFEATGDERFLDMGRRATVDLMASHVSHVGVHDHGFNNVSTYGNLLRMMAEGTIPESAWERRFYELALKLSGAVQASRWTSLPADQGFVYSFNGPHSLFSDTIRSMRALAVSHLLGHRLMGEGDKPIDLLGRIVRHAEATARYNVYFGTGRDAYDIRGRTAHESIFNPNDGAYRCPSSQQGYSPFSTWTRGLAWILCGYPEELEFIATLPDAALEPHGGRQAITARWLETAEAAADFYIDQTPTDGIPYWDTGAPGLANMDDYLARPADPFNDHEPVDSSAAVIAAQGLLRLGRYLRQNGQAEKGTRYWQAGLTVARTALSEAYLSSDPGHEGLIVHSVYHRPNGWDHVPPGRKVPCGESSMWGDYHARELALLLKREAEGKEWLAFYNVGATPLT
jgi:unsaturated chondroitin disaccharide hydrolase